MDDGSIQSALRHCQRPPELSGLMNDAADEIDSLRAALREIAELPDVRADEAATIAKTALQE